LRLKPTQKALWVGPKITFSTIVDRFAMPRYAHMSTLVVHGPARLRRRLLQYNRTIYITNYESFLDPDFCRAVIDAGFTVCVADEGHKIKNYSTDIKPTASVKRGNKWARSSTIVQTTANFLEVAKSFKSRWLLTATPGVGIQSWAMFYFLDFGQTLGPDFFKFSDRYFERCQYSRKIQLKPAMRTEFDKKVSEFWAKNAHQVKIEDCVSMPERNWQVRKVELSKA